MTSKKDRLLEMRFWKSFDRVGSLHADDENDGHTAGTDAADNGEESGANPLFQKYYASLLGSEWPAFEQSLSTDLPVTFRLNTSLFPLAAYAFRKKLETEFKHFKGTFVLVRGKVVPQIVDRVACLEAKANDMAFMPNKVDPWRVNTDRTGLLNAASLAPLRDSLFREVKLGHAIRQEIASMIPAEMLQVQSHHKVLDMCAAPGSKTEQLLEALGRNASGMVVANDSDPRRIQALRKRYAHSGGHPSLLITCSRGEILAKTCGPEYFDRIVCDVPCTGDGTIRKQPYLWRRWRPQRALLLHSIQLQLALSAATALKVGGRLAYSTCSLNPIEDEAVVWAALKATKGALRLVDCRSEGLLPQLVRRDGITTWAASQDVLWEEVQRRDSRRNDQNKAGATSEEGIKSFMDDAKAFGSKRAKKRRKKQMGDGFIARPAIASTMLPPADDDEGASVLKRCMRIMPHDQDTGGFFVAIFEKVSPYAFEAGSEAVDEEASLKVLRGMGFNATVGKDTDLTYTDLDNETISSCALNVDAAAPTKLMRQNPGASITVASSAVRDAIGGWAKEIGVVAGTEAIVVRRHTCTSDRWSNLRILPKSSAWMWPHMAEGAALALPPQDVSNIIVRALNVLLESAEDDGNGNMIPASQAHLYLPDLTYGDFSVSMETVMAIAAWCEDASPGAPLLVRPTPTTVSAASNSAPDERPQKRRRLSKAERKKFKKQASKGAGAQANKDRDVNSRASSFAVDGAGVTLVLRRDDEDTVIVDVEPSRLQSYCEALSAIV